MKKFIESYKRYKFLSQYGYYRLCWIPIIKNWAVMEFFDDELPKIDISKVEIVLK